jgi:tetratricopeptide (TPR) repeat protein
MKRLALSLAVAVLAGTASAAATSTASATAPPALAAALQKVAAHDDAAALPLFEAALAADPDSLEAASEYRQAVIRLGAYDRALAFFAKLVADHPRSAAAELNYGYAYVDEIPAAGAITRVILANDALGHFTRSLELQKTWLGLYTRGNSYLYWPKVFGRGPLAVADLEEAVAMSKQGAKRVYHVRAYVALGDGYWRTDQKEKARATWQEGLKRFPDDGQLKARLARLARDTEELDAYLYDQLDPNQRVDTNLRELWAEP